MILGHKIRLPISTWTGGKSAGDCGPIAVINALKWLGDGPTLKKDYWIIRDCLVSPLIGGTNPKWMAKCLRKLPFLKVYEPRSLMSDKFFRLLRKPKTVTLISFKLDNRKRMGHTCAVIIYKNKLVFINLYVEEKATQLSETEFKRLMIHQPIDWPNIIFLTRIK